MPLWIAINALCFKGRPLTSPLEQGGPAAPALTPAMAPAQPLPSPAALAGPKPCAPVQEGGAGCALGP